MERLTRFFAALIRWGLTLCALFVVLVALYKITAPPKSAKLEKMTTTEPRWVRWVGCCSSRRVCRVCLRPPPPW